MSAPAEVGTRALPGWVLPLLIAALATLQLAAFHWGVIMPDALVQYEQALSGDYADWHPPVMAWIWRWLGAARFGSAPMLLLDITLYWLGLGLIAEALRRRGRRGIALLPLAVGAMPIAFGQLGAVLKDSLLAACLVAATGVAAWSMTRDRPVRGGSRALLLGSLAIAAATRVNAPLACAPLLLLALPVPPATLRWTLAAMMPALLLMLDVHQLIDHAWLRPHAQHPFLSQVNIDLAGITLASGDNVYPAAARPERALLAACYTPAQFNPHYEEACNGVEGGLHTLYDARDGALHLWLGAILSHSGAYVRHRLAHLNANQRWLVPKLPDDAVFITSTPNELGLRFTANRLTMLIYRAATWLAWSPLGRPATWLAVAAAILLMQPPPLPRALALSALLYGGGYAVASVAPDLRYNLWTMLAAMLASVLMLRGEQMTHRHWRSRTAALLCAVVVGGEVIALAAA